MIENNFITVHNAENFFAGIALVGAVNNSTIQGNTIMGDAGVALGLFPGDDLPNAVQNHNPMLKTLLFALRLLFRGNYRARVEPVALLD